MKLGRVVLDAPGRDRTTRAHLRQPVLGRVAPSELLEASDKAKSLIARAEAEAIAIMERAEARAATLATELATRARAEAASAVAARELVLADRESAALERQLDQVVELARLLAERLLGEALALDPTRIVALAREALREAHGARKITIAAHPDDVPLLETALGQGELDLPLLVVVDRERRRGSLRLETDIGTLDAELAPELERLAQKLRASLANG